MKYEIIILVICSLDKLMCLMLQVTFKEEHIPFLHFMTNICAIIGGKSYTLVLIMYSVIYIDMYVHLEHHFFFLPEQLVKNGFQFLSIGIFTVAGIVDSSIYYGQKTIKKKIEIGKYR